MYRILLTLTLALPGCTDKSEPDDTAITETCQTRQADIQAGIEAARACEVAEDCEFLGDHCPFGCGIVVASTEREGLSTEIQGWEADCTSCEYDCGAVEEIRCDDGLCTAVFAP